MARAEAFQIDAHTRVFIETTDIEPPPGIELVARSTSDMIDFSAAVDKALPAARKLLDKLRELANDVKQVEIAFGLKFSGEVGAVIAKTGTEANFTIKLVWEPASAERT